MLGVRAGKVRMRSLGTLKRVDVVLRRVAADCPDPLDLPCRFAARRDRLVEAQHRGTVTIVNTLSSGIRRWVRQAEVDTGEAAEVSSQPSRTSFSMFTMLRNA